MTRQLRGVNLGGWLVYEPWITPSIHSKFGPDVIDEWTWGEFIKVHPENRTQVLQHWDTWVTETDISKLSQYGITTLRIPIGRIVRDFCDFCDLIF